MADSDSTNTTIGTENTEPETTGTGTTGTETGSSPTSGDTSASGGTSSGGTSSEGTSSGGGTSTGEGTSSGGVSAGSESGSEVGTGTQETKPEIRFPSDVNELSRETLVEYKTTAKGMVDTICDQFIELATKIKADTTTSPVEYHDKISSLAVYYIHKALEWQKYDDAIYLKDHPSSASSTNDSQ